MVRFVWLILFIISVMSLPMFGQDVQWSRRATPTGGNIAALARSGRSIVAIQTFGGVYRSTDEGESWNFLTDALSKTAVFDLVAAPSGNLYVIGFLTLAISSDLGTTWKNKRLSFVPASIAFSTKGELFVGTAGRVMQSNDDGDTWTEIIPNPAINMSYSIAISHKGNWFAGAYSFGLYRSTNEGGDWERIDRQMGNRDVYSITTLPSSTIIVGLENEAWRSIDDGLSWTKVSGLDSVNTFGIVEGNDGACYAATNQGLAVSTDNGMTWRKKTTFKRLFGMSPTMYGVMVAADGSLYTSLDNGANWWPAADGMSPANWTALVIPNGESSLLVAGNERGGLYVSTDNGLTWQQTATGLEYGYSVRSISAPSNDRIAVLTENGFLITCDNGPEQWDVKSLPPGSGQMQAISARNTGAILLGDGKGNTFRSDNWGNSWVTGGRIELPGSNVSITKLLQDEFTSGQPVYAATDRGLFRSMNNGTTWDEITPEGVRLPVLDIVLTPGASQPIRTIAAALDRGIYYSVDNGVQWTKFCEAPATPILSLFLSREGYLAYHTEDGLYWGPLHTPEQPVLAFRNLPPETMLVSGRDLGKRYYAATRLHGIYASQTDVLNTGNAPAQPSDIELSVLPSPFGSASVSATFTPLLHFTLPAASVAALRVFDAAGRCVYQSLADRYHAGTHQILLDMTDLSAGVYTFMLVTETDIRTIRSVLLR